MRSRWLIAPAIIVALFTLQSLRHVGSGPWGVDGSYYMQVARHVAEGEGLLSSVCLYDQGMPALPGRTNIYPLWPLLLGLTARVMPLQAAATFLPRLLFVADLVLLYVLTNRIAGRNGYYGYAALLLLGLNPSFFSSTCYPYTEGLALFCTFGALIVLDLARNSGTTVYYAMCGVIAGLAFLTRSQMLMLGVAIGLVLIVAAVKRNESWIAVAAFCAGYAIAVLPWIVYLTTFVRPFTLSALVSMYSETPGLPVFDQAIATAGGLAHVLDRLSGVLVMFNPFSQLSFVSSFGLAALLVPVAAIYAAWRRQWVGGFLAAATGVAGLVMCAVLLQAHNRFFLEWLFGYRHGLPFILLLIVAMIQMTGRYARWIAIVFISLSIITNVPRVMAFATEPGPEWPSVAEKQLAAWLEHNDPRAIVLTTNAQPLSVVSRANFRWATCQQSPQDIARVLSLVRTDYVVVYEPEQACPFAKGLGRTLTPVATFGQAPNRIVLLKVRR